MSAVVIGSVPYLNARPLVRWFGDTEEGQATGIEVIEAVPSQLARMLERGEVAAALLSSFELLRRPELCYAPGIGVTAEGPVLSVRLLCRMPLHQVRTVALDTSSLTSVALLKILLTQRFGLTPRYEPAPPDLERMLRAADAALLIGDAGYRDYGAGIEALDLGAAWRDWTGLPFVYALWIGSPATLTPGLAAQLTRAKEWGKAHLEAIARTEYVRLNETYARTFRYLTEIMRYDVGGREKEALRRFASAAHAQGLMAALPDLDACEAA